MATKKQLERARQIHKEIGQISIEKRTAYQNEKLAWADKVLVKSATGGKGGIASDYK